MSERKIFTVVKKHIDSMDYYGLLAGGAPKDEFDCESEEISRRITARSEISEISAIIAEVFSRCFGESENSDEYMKLAAAIKDDLID